jgi:hypothetical protein
MSTTFQPLYARVSDHLGRKIPYLTASILFISGLVVCASTNLWAGLILGRAVSGLGTAGVMTMGTQIPDTIVMARELIICLRVGVIDGCSRGRETGVLSVDELCCLRDRFRVSHISR